MYVINGSVPHCAAVLTVPQCVPISSLSADLICRQLQKPPLQAPDWFTKSVWRIVWEVFPRDSAFSLCLLSSGLFQKSLPSSPCLLSPPPWSTPLNCPLFSICFLTSYLPSFLQAYPSPLADLAVCLSNRSQVMETRGCQSTIWRLLIHFSASQRSKV